jgi:phosphoenolpyruvate-protein kinase (PTS system EI component)
MILHESSNQNRIRGTVCTLSRCDFCFPVSRFRETEEIASLNQAIAKATNKVAGFLSAPIADAPLFSETFHFYDMMLKDPELESALIGIIQTEQVSAPEAVKRYFDRFMAHLSCQDSYFRNRCYDLEDLRNLLYESFSSTETARIISDDPNKQRILVLDTLLATDLVRAGFVKFAAVLARKGGMNSHAAILLESAGIPFVIVDPFPEDLPSGTTIEIDFSDHQITIEPNRIFSYRSENGYSPCNRSDDNAAFFTSSENYPAINWYVSLNFFAEGMRFAPENVEGVGLFRTEMMVFAENRFPSEWEQYSLYSQLADHFNQKPVFFRLWDIESDKVPEGLNVTAFGAAFLIQNPELTEKQLRALLQVSIHHPIGITIPMVSNPAEIIALRDMMDACKEEIRQKNPHCAFHVKIGTMVETTALIEHLDHLPTLDYLIVGSNDLVCDRLKISRHSDGFTPKLFIQAKFLTDLKQIVQKTAASQIPIYLCGEAANHIEAIQQIIQIGIHRFCPSPNGLLAFLAK